MRAGPEKHRRGRTIVSAEYDDDLLLGPFRAFVTDDADPKQRGVLLVRVPEVTGEASIYAEPLHSPMGGGLTDGKKWGSLFLPPVGASVYVEFMDGGPDHCVWLPGWFGQDELPDILAVNYPKRRGLVTPSGHFLFFDDSDGVNGNVQLGQRDGSVLAFGGDGSATLAAKSKTLLLNGGNSPLDATAAAARTGDAVHGGTVSATVLVAGTPVPVQFIYTPKDGIPGASGPTLVLSGGKITGGSANINLN